MIRFVLLAALLPVAAVAQMAAPEPAAPAPAASAPAAPAPPAPALHRLTADEIAAAEAEGAERNRAAELLAMTRGEPSLALTGEKRKPQVHGEAGVAFGSNGYREVFGAETTTLSNGSTISVAGDYGQIAPYRQRPR